MDHATWARIDKQPAGSRLSIVIDLSAARPLHRFGEPSIADRTYQTPELSVAVPSSGQPDALMSRRDRPLNSKVKL